ncbi:hypothetical protein GPECTOR_5g42 [Gonium pectorale]|uniref:Uncharacterized protein n=1 Tax=Gonium pectorale TaxID=33097 RepID=A0A150GWS7_GONPE|nr:hypothetical protein GPECTOR_5g42 [Gonium pectorale]|eukprot:KXZ54337.1 hypothetical protein GPECTOR_5g42 [Gonium pectorale]
MADTCSASSDASCTCRYKSTRCDDPSCCSVALPSPAALAHSGPCTCGCAIGRGLTNAAQGATITITGGSAATASRLVSDTSRLLDKQRTAPAPTPPAQAMPPSVPSAYATACALVNQSWSQPYTPVFTLSRLALKVPDRHPTDLPPAAEWALPYCEALGVQGVALVGAYVRPGCIQIVFDVVDLAGVGRLVVAGGGGGTLTPAAHRPMLANGGPAGGGVGAPPNLGSSSPAVSADTGARRLARRNAPTRVWSEGAALLGSSQASPSAQLSASAALALANGSRGSSAGNSTDGADGGEEGGEPRRRQRRGAARRLRQTRTASVPALSLRSPAASHDTSTPNHVPSIQRLLESSGSSDAGSRRQSGFGRETQAAAAADAAVEGGAGPTQLQSLPPAAWVELLGPQIGGGGQTVLVQMPFGGGAWHVQLDASAPGGHREVPLRAAPPDLMCVSPPCVLAGAPAPLTLYAAGADLHGGSAGAAPGGGIGSGGGGGGAPPAPDRGPLAVHVRFQGGHVPCRASLLGDQMSADALSRVLPPHALRRAEVMRLQLRAAPASPGLMFVECQRGGLLGAAQPVFVAPNAGVWQEVVGLAGGGSRAGHHSDPVEVQKLVTDLGVLFDYLGAAEDRALPPQPQPSPEAVQAGPAQQPAGSELPELLPGWVLARATQHEQEHQQQRQQPEAELPCPFTTTWTAPLALQPQEGLGAARGPSAHAGAAGAGGQSGPEAVRPAAATALWPETVTAAAALAGGSDRGLFARSLLELLAEVERDGSPSGGGAAAAAHAAGPLAAVLPLPPAGPAWGAPSVPQAGQEARPAGHISNVVHEAGAEDMPPPQLGVAYGSAPGQAGAFAGVASATLRASSYGTELLAELRSWDSMTDVMAASLALSSVATSSDFSLVQLPQGAAAAQLLTGEMPSLAPALAPALPLSSPLPPDAAPRPVAPEPTPASRQRISGGQALAGRMRRLGVGLLCFAVRRGWPHTSRAVLEALLGPLGMNLGEVDAAVAEREGGLRLLHVAVTSRQPVLLRMLLSLAPPAGDGGSAAAGSSSSSSSSVGDGGSDGGFAWDASVQGPGGLTPLHLATALDDRGAMAAALLQLVPSAARLWFASPDDSGCTPADMAAMAGLEELSGLARARLADQCAAHHLRALQSRLAARAALEPLMHAHGAQEARAGLLQDGLRPREAARTGGTDTGDSAPEQEQQAQGAAAAVELPRARLSASDAAVSADDVALRGEAGAGTDAGEPSSSGAERLPAGPNHDLASPMGPAAKRAARPAGESSSRRAAALLRLSVRGFSDPRVEARYRLFRAESLAVVDATCGAVFLVMFLVPAVVLLRQRDWTELVSHCVFNAGLLGPYALRALDRRAFLRHRNMALLSADAGKALLAMLTLAGLLPYPKVWANFTRGNMDLIMLVIIKPLSEQVTVPIALVQRVVGSFTDAHIYAHVSYSGAVLPSLMRALAQGLLALLFLTLLDMLGGNGNHSKAE